MDEIGLESGSFGPECLEAVTRLGHERASLTSILASMVDGILLVDADDKVAYWNPRAGELLGASFAPSVRWSLDALERHLAACTVDPERSLSALRRAPDELHDLPTVELDILRSRRLVQARLFPIHGPNAEDLGCGILLRDITDRREADRVKARLLAMVSHELRAPLASIKGFATTLLRRDVEWDGDAQHEFLEIIDRESDRLTELVDDLFDSSRLILGEYPIELETTHLGGLLRGVVSQAAARASTHRFVTHVPDELPPARADERRIRQVLHNLLDNASKYSPEGSTIQVGVQVQGGELLISIRDQGPGIAAAEQGLIFEPFYRGQATRGSRQKGLGLGLAICRGIVDAHGGRIWVESQPGQEASFHFTLPIAEPVAEPEDDMGMDLVAESVNDGRWT